VLRAGGDDRRQKRHRIEQRSRGLCHLLLGVIVGLGLEIRV